LLTSHLLPFFLISALLQSTSIYLEGHL